METNKNFLFMAIAKGQQSNDNVEVKRYIGVAPVSVLAVNPTKEQIKELMGYEPKEVPVYTGVQEIDGKKVEYARVTFVVRTDAERCGIETTQMLSYFIRNQYQRGSQSGKYRVLDAYNNSAWATEETIKAKEQVMYSNGPAKLIGEYRPAYYGEWEFTNFIRQFICVGSAGETNGFDYINGSWIPKTGDDLKSCECSFTNDEIQKMFKGDFKAVKDAIALQPTNKVKVLFGIRESDGREYQDIYGAYVLRSYTNDYAKLQANVEEAKANGGLNNRIYEFCNIKEYKVTPTDFSKPAGETAETPFGPATQNTPW